MHAAGAADREPQVLTMTTAPGQTAVAAGACIAAAGRHKQAWPQEISVLAVAVVVAVVAVAVVWEVDRLVSLRHAGEGKAALHRHLASLSNPGLLYQ